VIATASADTPLGGAPVRFERIPRCRSLSFRRGLVQSRGARRHRARITLDEPASPRELTATLTATAAVHIPRWLRDEGPVIGTLCACGWRWMPAVQFPMGDHQLAWLLHLRPDHHGSTVQMTARG